MLSKTISLCFILVALTHLGYGQLPTLAPIPTLATLPPAGGLLGDFLKLFPTLGPIPTLPSISLPSLPDAPCVGTTSLQSGTCRKDGDCKARGGIADGQCSLNLGTCCAKVPTCGATSVLNNTYFINPEYPNATKTSKICPITITKLTAVVQVRIDFIDVTLEGPGSEGSCLGDSINIDGANSGFVVPRLCGKLSGQHIYIPVDQTAHASQITIYISLSGKVAATWLIKVTQIDPLQGVRAPAGCLQYYYGDLQGNITNFNYDVAAKSALGNIASLSYSICFRKESGYCGVKFQPTIGRSKRGAPYYPTPNQVGNRPASYYGRYIQRQPQYGYPHTAYGAPVSYKVKVPFAYRPPYSSPFEYGWSPANDSSVYVPAIRPPNVPEEPANSTDIFDVPVEPGMNIPKPTNGTITDNKPACTGEDSIYFPPSDHLCAKVGYRPVTTRISPLTVYVDNSGVKHSKGFSFNYNYTSC